MIGCRIVMDTGPGAHLTVGHGWDMSHGAGPHITTVVGSTTTTTGPGVRVVITTVIAAGGGRRWWPLFPFIFLSETATAGILCLITSVIHAHGTTATATMID